MGILGTWQIHTETPHHEEDCTGQQEADGKDFF
jgi:hypothetical protein